MLTSDLQPTPPECSEASEGAVMGLHPPAEWRGARGGDGTRRKHLFGGGDAANGGPDAAGGSRMQPPAVIRTACCPPRSARCNPRRRFSVYTGKGRLERE
jgi:hypothetical protein